MFEGDFDLRKLVFTTLVGVLLAAFGFRIYQEIQEDQTLAQDDRKTGASDILLVETATVRSHTFEKKIQTMGELRPKAIVQVMSRVSGRLQKVLVDRGEAVNEGELLAVVDDVALQQQIQRAEASVQMATAAVKREQSNYENMVIRVERYRGLYNESLISDQDLEELENRLYMSRAQLELLQAQVLQTEAALRELKVQHSQTRVYSPLKGFVGTRHLDPGALVSPSVPIVSVLDLDRVRTVVPVTETVIRKIRLGLPADIVVAAYPDRTFRGTITRISPFLNTETRSADIEIEVENRDYSLKPGMSAYVTVDARVSKRSLSIPRSALLTMGTQNGVYFAAEDGAVVFHKVQVGRIDDEAVEIVNGLQEGQQIISRGAQNLNDGDLVRTQ